MKRSEFVLCAMLVMVGMLLATQVPAGDLNPPGPPTSTMKTLEQVPPTWDQILPSTNGDADGCNSTRFKCVMGGAAVLDKETGLVWEKSPDTLSVDWHTAFLNCYGKQVGGRRGWRLPALEELTSLGYLRAGLPFTNIQTADFSYYWSATTDGVQNAWFARFGDNYIWRYAKDLNGNSFAWCVRGASGHNAQ